MAKPKTTPHSVRVQDDHWNKAKVRAAGDGLAMNSVIAELVEGYARGMINLPKVTKQYVTGPATAGATATAPPAASGTHRATTVED